MKIYVEPEIKIVELVAKDILNVSTGEDELPFNPKNTFSDGYVN